MRVAAVTGERQAGMSPAALETLVFHRLLSSSEAKRFSEQAPRRRRPLESIHDALPRVIEELEECMQAKSTSELIERCTRFLGINLTPSPGDRRHISPRTLLSDLAWTLLDEDDSEGCIVTATLFSTLLTPEDEDVPTATFLETIAQRYIASTRYLVALLADYARRASAMARELDIDTFVLFLRDGLAFWPAFQALNAREPARALTFQHLVYTRPLREKHGAPLITRREDGYCEVGELSPIREAMLLDVGLYGSLIQSLHDDGYLEKDNLVAFVGSRNPQIDGFLGRAAPLSLPETIALVDTIECLMKPIQLVTRSVGSKHEILLRVSDPISFICSMCFMRELYNYEGIEPWHLLERGSWFLEEPIPAWSGASKFLASWSVPSCRAPVPASPNATSIATPPNGARP